LILRGVIGAAMIAHGVRHGRSLDGTARWFGSIGFRQPRLQAQLSSVLEVASGTAIAVGAATPASSAAVIGTMAVAARTVHRPNGYFVTAEGWEYVAFIAAASVALSALGPGRVSVDRALGLDEIGSPGRRAATTVGLGLGGAAAQLKLFWTDPAGER
jgi:putative oxidoreductase